jgi:hypothetical protein
MKLLDLQVFDQFSRDKPYRELFTNLMVASLMLNAFYALRQGGVNYSEAYLDIVQNLSRTVSRPG